ncbi:MAG: helix-hairpin-helix domain-containing protein [Candidatus Hermodarchaeota archaeon]
MTVLEDQLPRKKEDTEIYEEQLASDSLTISFKKGDLTVIKGIGPNVAEKLKAQGYITVEDIANANVRQISLIKGIGLSTAEKFIENAKAYLQIHNKDLSTFSIPQISDTSSNEYSVEEVKKDESVPLEIIDETPCKVEIKPWFDPKYKISRLGKSYDVKKERVLGDNIEEIDENLDENRDIPKDYEDEESLHKGFIEEPSFLPRNESSNSTQIEMIDIQISRDLERLGFYLLKKTPELRQLFLGIDMLAIKLVRAKEFLDFIYIIPLKISTLKGVLVVSETTIEYRPTTEEKDTLFKMRGVPESILKGLHNSGQKIFQDILNIGTLYKLIKQYLQIDISLKKTVIRETLFFHSGPLQYRFLLEPILISQGTVGFTEKLIPFAYHKHTNIHIIEVSQLSNFLDYIDQKYLLIENYTQQKTSIELHEESMYKFSKDIRNFSAPFMLFGFVFLSLLIFQAYSVLSIFISLGYGVSALYGIGFGYLYLKYHQQKVAIKNELSTPYYQRKYEFKKPDLDLIAEEFSPKLMEQFIYECVNKEIASNIISKIERENAEAYFSSKVAQKTIEEDSLFEAETPTPLVKEKRNSEFTEQLSDKFSSFLED